MWYRLRDFVRDVCSYWVSLVSGLASFIMAALAAIFRDSLEPIIFWPVAYICLLVAGYRVWRKERVARIQAEARLPSRIDEKRRAGVKKELSQFNEAEKDALRRIQAWDPKPKSSSATISKNVVMTGGKVTLGP